MFNNFQKPGQGIDKNEPEKRGIFLFFELFFRKFWNYAGLNILYFLCLAPFLFGSFVLSFVMVPPVLSIILIPTLLGFSIVTPGFVYILRNYSWEQHAWLARDYFKAIKDNIVQSLLLFVLDVVALLLLYNNIVFYMGVDFGNGVSIALAVVNASIALVLLMMHMYLYVIMVTFRMKFIEILKNALILTFAKFPINFILLVLAVWTGILVAQIPYGFWLPVAGVIAISFIGLMLTFYPARVVKKYMIKDNNAGSDDEKIMFSDKE